MPLFPLIKLLRSRRTKIVLFSLGLGFVSIGFQNCSKYAAPQSATSASENQSNVRPTMPIPRTSVPPKKSGPLTVESIVASAEQKDLLLETKTLSPKAQELIKFQKRFLANLVSRKILAQDCNALLTEMPKLQSGTYTFFINGDPKQRVLKHCELENGYLVTQTDVKRGPK